MSWWIWALIVIYALGFVATFILHIVALPMVTPGLAFLRSLVWPVFFLTGKPHGRQLPMD